jgi:hypothetical protein
LPVSSATGLIDISDHTGESLKLKMLLNPNAKIGQLLRIDDEAGARGLYYLMIADHVGDTRALEWYTSALCLAVDATQVPGEISERLKPKPLQGPIKTH